MLLQRGFSVQGHLGVKRSLTKDCGGGCLCRRLGGKDRSGKSTVGAKAVLVMSSGGKMLTSLRLLLRGCFDGVLATSGPGRVATLLAAHHVSMIVLSVGFSTNVGGNGRKLC